MRFLPTQTHGVLDYATGVLLMVAPWLFGFGRGGAETWVLVIAGIGAIAYSMLTDYELGYIKVLSMPVHLILDLLSGIFLAASPWLFGFAGQVFLPHLLLGLFEIGSSLVTQKAPAYQYLADDTAKRNR